MSLFCNIFGVLLHYVLGRHLEIAGTGNMYLLKKHFTLYKGWQDVLAT